MQLREVSQHHLPAVFSIILLFTIDTCAYYITCYFIDSNMLNIEYGINWISYFIVIGIIYLFRCYNPSPRISILKESKTIIQAIFFISAIYILVKILLNETTIKEAQKILLSAHLFLIIDIISRIIIRSSQRLLLKQGYGGRNTIILGGGIEAINLANQIKLNPAFGFKIIGYFHDKASEQMNNFCKYLGRINNIDQFVKSNKVHEMIIAWENNEHRELLNMIGKYEELDICLKIVPDMYEAISGQAKIDILNGIHLMDINPHIMTEFQYVIKRLFDIIFSIFSIILLLPLILFIIVTIKLNTPGNIFYKQVRLGKNGEKFYLYKFRSMFQNSENITGPVWACTNDKRITRVGRVLRKFHLDEIPQLYNVLMGKMSVIGPRPERPEIIQGLEQNISYYSHRMKVKPGITGWAQITGSYDSNIDDVLIKLKHDFFYIENISLFLDFKILFKTIIKVLKGTGR